MVSAAKRRVALAGTGHRGAGTWGKELIANCSEWVELVGLCDANALRLARAREAIGTAAPAFTDLREMLDNTRPDTLVVATRDDTHADIVVAALEAGVDVVVEKPMATTAEGCRRILAAERSTGRRVDVGFNYRFSPTAEKIKELLLSDAIGEVASVDFHWFLDVKHGADYFRRWHAKAEHSGSLFVHKATHHFDLLNWCLGSEPDEVFARAALHHYGSRGPFRGVRCKTCPHSGECPHYFDVGKDPWLDMLYEAPSAEDGYFRDACVFREEIDIPDTMSASIRFENGVQATWCSTRSCPSRAITSPSTARAEDWRSASTSASRGTAATPTKSCSCPISARPSASASSIGPAAISAAIRRCKEGCLRPPSPTRSASAPGRWPARCRC